MSDVHLVTPKCGTDSRYSPPCADEANVSEPSLFVVVAHVPGSHDATLLSSALHSIRCHHPGSPILVVDNDTPLPGVAGIMATDKRFARYAHERGSSAAGPLRIVRRSPSWSALSAWAAADEALQLPQLHGFPEGIERVVFMQHSMRLCAPIPPSRPDCAATALSGFMKVAGTTRGWVFRTELGWVSQLAEAAGIACAPPCHRSGLPCGDEQPCLEWYSATHWAIAYSREGFRRFASYQLWPPLSGAWTLPRAARDFILDNRHTWSSTGTNGTARRGATLAQLAVGFERLAGITFSSLNNSTLPPRTRAARVCTAAAGWLDPKVVLLEKVHAGSALRKGR